MATVGAYVSWMDISLVVNDTYIRYDGVLGYVIRYDGVLGYVIRYDGVLGYVIRYDGMLGYVIRYTSYITIHCTM